jgi:hypothetical protein
MRTTFVEAFTRQRCSLIKEQKKMRHIRTVGLCLAAAFALGVVAASNASGADLLARVAGGGSITNAAFLSSTTLPLLIAKDGRKIHCKDATNYGLFSSSTLGNILMRFLGCTIDEVSFTMNCNTSGAAIGEIHFPLSTLFRLGLAHLGTNKTIPAIVILPGKTAEITCESSKIEVRGSVIGALQKPNGEQVELGKPLSEVNLNFQQTANGLQDLRLILLPGSTTPTTYDLESSFFGAFELMSEVANDTFNSFTLSNGKIISLELVEP